MKDGSRSGLSLEGQKGEVPDGSLMVLAKVGFEVEMQVKTLMNASPSREDRSFSWVVIWAKSPHTLPATEWGG